MDANKVCAALQLTLQPDPTKQGENLLKEMHKVIGFTPLLLKIILEQSVAAEIRQAAVLYFKNNVISYWQQNDDDSLSSHKENETDKFSIHEDDKLIIRQNIVKAIVSCPTPLQVQLKSALNIILSNDYPEKYDYFFHLLQEHLTGNNYDSLYGALLALHAFFKRFEYSKREAWLMADKAMGSLLPHLTQFMTRFVLDRSKEAYTLQKSILKCLKSYTSYHFNPETMNKEILPIWINICYKILEDRNPDHDGDSEGIYWKNKKWAINFIINIFDRYGNPGSTQKIYREFAQHFLATHTEQLMNIVLGLLSRPDYISPRVQATALLYLSAALNQSFAWKMIKPHFDSLLKQVLHPLLCHTQDDEDLWEEDSNEFIRYRCVDIESEQNPSWAAYALLEAASSQRKGILQSVMEYCLHVLNSPASDKEKEKDGALHIIGAVHETLLKRKNYKNQLEAFLVNYVFPTLRSPLRYRRARACWLLDKLADSEFNNKQILGQAVSAIYQLMMSDPEKPCQVFAAMALVRVCAAQERAQDVLKPHLADLFIKLLDLLRETEFDELNELIATCMSVYCDDLHPIALEIIARIMNIVNNFLGRRTQRSGELAEGEEEDYEEEAKLDMIDSTLSNASSILTACLEHQKILDGAEPEVIKCLRNVMQHQVSELYETIFDVFNVLQTNVISPAQWQVVDWMHEAWQGNLSEYISDTADVLHRFIVAKPDQLLAQPEKMKKIVEMLLHAMNQTSYDLEDPARAAKLLECMLLQYSGVEMQPYVAQIVETSLMRFCKQEENVPELKTMCLQLIATSLLQCHEAVLPVLQSHPWPGSTDMTILDQYMQVWLANCKNLAGLHDRRVFVLVLCKLLSLTPEMRPTILERLSAQYLPCMLKMFSALPAMYTLKAKLEEESDDEDDDDGEDFDDDEGGDVKSRNLEEGMASDEDGIDDEAQEFYETCENFNIQNDLSQEINTDELTELEEFETKLDQNEHDHEEFVVFYQTMLVLEQSQPQWYNQLIVNLQEEQKSELASIAGTALKTMQLQESRKIERAGGYDFKQTTVPTSFNFGGDKN